MFCDLDVFALCPSNADWGAEEEAEGDATAAFPDLPRSIGLSLTGDSENDRAGQRLAVLVHQRDPSAGSVLWNAQEDRPGGGARG